MNGLQKSYIKVLGTVNSYDFLGTDLSTLPWI